MHESERHPDGDAQGDSEGESAGVDTTADLIAGWLGGAGESPSPSRCVSLADLVLLCRQQSASWSEIPSRRAG